MHKFVPDENDLFKNILSCLEGREKIPHLASKVGAAIDYDLHYVAADYFCSNIKRRYLREE